ncbi:hypothetical protein SAMN05421747_101296 [Parapedobacter composti]|uniref:Uncharacterized protein n=1 Tax=Parapedobacter composti TaxID=623281 RepID=A0A1I1E3B7_9SPHI|nr:hypothetical protein [Parapedobacter composti]SFB81671.1 hypothetical protein SAMN05421747_101296 [Parapedobacter composti]
MKQLMQLSWLTILLFACNNTTQQNKDGSDSLALLPIVNNPEHPSHIFLRLVDAEEDETSITYVAKGLYQDDTVGFIINVNKDIPVGINADGSVNEASGFKKGAITFRKEGAMSDRFITALAELWKVNEVDAMKAAPVQPLVFSSNRIPVNLNNRATYSFKLFFAEDAPAPGEIFFMVDTYKRGIEFQEKDPQYRSTIVHALGD